MVGPVALLGALLAGCGGHSSAATGTTVARPSASTSVTATTVITATSPASASTGTSSAPATGAVVRPTSPARARPTVPPTVAVARSCDVGPQSPPPSSLAANFATALAFAPDGRLFYAERGGTVRAIQGGASRVFATVSTVTTEPGGGYSERGLLGLVIDPRFTQNRYVYAFYSDVDRVSQDVIRWTDCGGAGTAPRIVIRLPAGPDCCHKGGRLAFGPDGKLYVTLGEEHTAPAAQNPSDVRGKVLRYNPDGTVPADNPFGPGNPVWAYGFRNPFGIAFSSGGQLAVTSNGPSGEIAGGPATGYDTVVAAVARGGGYQWPNCYGYNHPLPGAAGCGTGQFGPDWSSEATTVVPTGATFVDPSGPSGYAGHLVFCTFGAGMKIYLAPAVVASGPPECRLDVKQGPDHALYYSDTGHIYRLG